MKTKLCPECNHHQVDTTKERCVICQSYKDQYGNPSTDTPQTLCEECQTFHYEKGKYCKLCKPHIKGEEDEENK